MMRSAATLLVVGFAAASGQKPTPLVERGAIDRGFTYVANVRELPDGRVIVVDLTDRTVMVADFRSREATVVGRAGAGPGEYVSPSQVFALGGGRSAILDAGNARLLLLDDAAKPTGTIPLRGPTRGSSFPPTVAATDLRGYLYGLGQPIAGQRLADSAAVERWRPNASGRDTAGYVPVRHRPGSQVMAGLVVSPAGEAQAFATEPQWAIAQDGRVGVVTPDPYRVTIYDTSGRAAAGLLLAYTPVRVTDVHKTAWRAEQQRPRQASVLARGGRQETRVMRMTYKEPSRWPDVLPPFLYAAIQFAPDGMLWIQRTNNESEPLFDVVDGRGRVVRQLQLPRGARLVGLGVRTAYAVMIDQDDVEKLRRFDVPP